MNTKETKTATDNADTELTAEETSSPVTDEVIESASEGTTEGTSEKSDGALIGELSPSDAESTDTAADTADTADTAESAEETTGDVESIKIDAPDDSAQNGGYVLPSGSWLYIALAIVSALLLILVFDKLRIKKKKSVAESVSDAESSPSPSSDSPRSVKASYIHGIGAREDQQDSYSLSDLSDQGQGIMAVVADGMGGLSNGSLVSGLLARSFKERHRTYSPSTPADEMLLECALYANAEVNQALIGAERSGSTLVSVIIKDSKLHFLTVGDSHLYLYRSGALILLNREHIYREELAVKALNRTAPLASVKGDRQSKALTSYFGIGNIPHIDRSCGGIKLMHGDRLLLCTDGVYGTLSEDQLNSSLSLPLKEAAAEIEECIKLADSPYQDNYTALILEYNG